MILPWDALFNQLKSLWTMFPIFNELQIMQKEVVDVPLACISALRAYSVLRRPIRDPGRAPVGLEA